MADHPSNLKTTEDPPPVIRMDYAEPKVGRRPNRVVAWVRGWTDEHLSRENMSTVVKTLLWVVPLTLLIWIYAERQQQATMTVPLPLSVATTDPSKVVHVLRPADGNVVVELKGPKIALEKVRRQFDPTMGNDPVRIVLDRSVPENLQTISAKRIEQDSRLAGAGITVVSAQPAEIQILVDRVEEREVPIVPPPQFRQLGATPPKFEPATVKVRGPARTLAAAKNLEVVADLTSRLNGATPTDEEVVLKDVKLTLVGVEEDQNVTYGPASVTARVMPLSARETVLPAVRVLVAAPKQILDRYTIDLVDLPSETIPNVRVAGPEEVINRLIDSNAAPSAYIELPESVLLAGEGEVPLRYELPEGVVVREGQRTLRVAVRPR